MKTLKTLNSFKKVMTVALCFVVSFGLASSSIAQAKSLPIQAFPLEKYEQNIDQWVNPKDPSYTQPLVDKAYQLKRLEELHRHYFDSSDKGLSPWSKNYLTHIFKNQNTFTLQTQITNGFNNHSKDKDRRYIGYGENFRPYERKWFDKIQKNLNLDQFKSLNSYSDDNRGILVQNTYARALPSLDPYFYYYEVPGQGYPFDMIQMSALWVGTPIYVLGETLDKEWSLVVTPEVTAWIPSEAFAKVNQRFINLWESTAKKNLGAIINTETPIFDVDHKHYYLKAYVGTILPYYTQKGSSFTALFPVKDMSGMAEIKRALISKEHMVEMPWAATPENFVKLIKTLQNRPYGWGGLYFYNDCSAEMKSIFTTFGIWLPRNSFAQRLSGKLVNKNDAKLEDRIEYLKIHGKPFMTVVYNSKHVFLYLGNYAKPNGKDSTLIPLTYQNMWGLSPKGGSHRAVIGQSVVFPLLKSFAEDPSLQSQASKKDFQMIFLNEWPEG